MGWLFLSARRIFETAGRDVRGARRLFRISAGRRRRIQRSAAERADAEAAGERVGRREAGMSDAYPVFVIARQPQADEAIQQQCPIWCRRWIAWARHAAPLRSSQ